MIELELHHFLYRLGRLKRLTPLHSSGEKIVFPEPEAAVCENMPAMIHITVWKPHDQKGFLRRPSLERLQKMKNCFFAREGYYPQQILRPGITVTVDELRKEPKKVSEVFRELKNGFTKQVLK